MVAIWRAPIWQPVVPATSREPYRLVYRFRKAVRRPVVTRSAGGYGSRLGGRDDDGVDLIPELLAQYPLFQAVAGVEQHPHRDGLVGQDLDAADVARLVVIGDRRDRAFVAFEDLDHHIGGVGQQRPAPAPRAKRADRGERQQGGVRSEEHTSE